MAEFAKQVDGPVTIDPSVPASPKIDSPGSGSPSYTPDKRPRKPCIFFQQGKCNKGDDCQYLHVLTKQPTNNMGYTNSNSGSYGNNLNQLGQQQQTLSEQPEPTIIELEAGTPVFSIDVECVATSKLHNARSVAHIALVDEWCRPVCSLFIKQEKPVASYLTAVTGVTEELIEKHGIFLSDALIMLRQHLPPTAILVGQNIRKDVEWLNLAEGLDFASMIDLAALFRVWNARFGCYTIFSQDHIAKVWLNMPDRPNHDALSDAMISMNLFNAYRTYQYDIETLRRMQLHTLNTPRSLSYSATNPMIDGCCLGHRKTCTCGAPFFITG